MDFIIRTANLDMDAADVGDIPSEDAEKEIKKAYLALKIWMMRLSSESNMDWPTEDDITEDFDSANGIQIPLFSPEDYE